MDYIISECSRNGGTYAWTRNTFWVWDKNVKKWFESGFARELFEKAKAKDPILTETDYFTFSDEFVGMDDWEVTAEMLAALEQATKGEMAPEENPTSALCSPADAGAVRAPALSGAATVSLEDGQACFDYSEFSEQTVTALKDALRIFRHGKSMAEIGLRSMADAVGLAHDELCGGVVAQSDNSKHGNRGENSFRRFCQVELGISKDTAYRLLQVSDLYSESSPKQQKVLEQLTPSLLYAAAKPSAPAELVQRVKDGDIKSHKEFREMEAAWKAAEKRADDLKAELTNRDADVSRLAADAEKAERERDQKAEALRASQEYARKAEARAVVAEREAAQAKRKVDQQEDQLEELQDLYDDARNRANDLQAELNAASAAPVEAVMADPEEIERRVKEKVDAEEAKWKERYREQQQKISRLEKESGMAGRVLAVAHAVDDLLKGLAEDLSDHGIDLNAVTPINDLSAMLGDWADGFYAAVNDDEDDDDDE